ncbi:follicle cell protein 3C-1 [Drosophila serrata]|uniref:follicle cell protein 3C-1 n=1 Tax=Drosophila serrata TaxID=7274 RepID=UPI000A1D3534|nr:follicle cell protein 3C-1 [Drosophila serrata]
MAAFRNSLLLLVLLLALHLEQASKIAYKKPLYGKTNYIKEKKLRSKGLKVETTTASTTTTTTTTGSTTEEDWPSAVEFVIVATTPRNELEASEEPLNNSTSSTIETATAMPVETSSTRPGDVSSKTVESFNQTTMPMSTTTSSTLINTLPSPPMPGAAGEVVSSPPIPDNQPVPCTCGVFLSSQIPNGLPTAPLINQELDRMFPCNAIGRKQCQTKCLEAIVQHLPNSANIVCSALGHDCHKERAYLFIKNCHNQWVNTNLQAGREYCCRGGVPYRCPLMG